MPSVSRVTRLLLLVAAIVATAAQAEQPPVSQSTTFEAASIRPVEWHMGCHSSLPSGSTHFGVTCRPLLALIAMAWNVTGDEIQGGDRSALGTLYDVNATVPDNKPWSDFNTIRPMLRQLLIERFHLSVHTGSKKEAGYGLYIAKGGAKLKPSKRDISQEGEAAGAPSANWLSDSHVQSRGANMFHVTSLFSLALREPVVDHTGLSGTFNIDLDFAPLRSTNAAATDSPLPSFFSAVEDTLGLQLRPEQVTVPNLIIDHVDANPSPN
jgi:uncharacterized protein (TIGR03435 family)